MDTLQLFNEIESIICDTLYCDMRLIRMQRETNNKRQFQSSVEITQYRLVHYIKSAHNILP